MENKNIEQEKFDTPGVDEDTGMDPSEIKSTRFIKNPEVNQRILLQVLKIDNKQPTQVTKADKTTFDVGITDSTTKERYRFDIVCPDGVWTIPNWELYAKLLGPKGVLTEYALRDGKIEGKSKYFGAQVEITKLHDGGDLLLKPDKLMKLKDFKSLKETEDYQAELRKAQQEKRLYEVKLLN